MTEDGGTPGKGESESDGGATPPAPSSTLPASEYCESIADSFCDFYLRCGRMVAADTNECHTVFLETCNARYEPRYVDLERANLLSLSRAGVDACAAHLAKVACTEQVSDLDGPCGGMWVGTRPAGGSCAIDVESFVCAPGTTCILGLDFCGTCETSSPRGGPCAPGGTRCASDDACVDGTCVARGVPGATCSETQPCIVGAACTDGTCVSPTVVGEGEACDAKRRCAYRSYCSGGKCVRGSLLGETCASNGACVSGRCVSGTCTELRGDGETCSTNLECRSGQCATKKCAPLPSACLTK